MRWLLHGQLAPSVAQALRRHGHVAQTQADAKIDSVEPAEVLKEAQRLQLDVITSDGSFASAPFDLPFGFARSIVFLQLQGGDVEQDGAIDRLFQRYKSPAPGRLYTVTASRVKVRQLPGKP